MLRGSMDAYSYCKATEKYPIKSSTQKIINPKSSTKKQLP